MAKICLADHSKFQTCNNCALYQLDADRSEKYGKIMYSCCATAKNGFVNWERRKVGVK